MKIIVLAFVMVIGFYMGWSSAEENLKGNRGFPNIPGSILNVLHFEDKANSSLYI